MRELRSRIAELELRLKRVRDVLLAMRMAPSTREQAVSAAIGLCEER